MREGESKKCHAVIVEQSLFGLLSYTLTITMSETKKQKMAPANPRIIALFDVDGTLTIPRGGECTEMNL